MKKSTFVLVLACVMVFAFASSAFARWGGSSPTSIYNTTSATNGPNRETSEFVTWETVELLGTDGAFNTPHKGYTTSTTLCAVCHSVHFAPVWAGAPIGGVTNANFTGPVGEGIAAADADKLLRTSVGASCNYCHIETNIGGIQIYAGDTRIYGRTDGVQSENFENSYAHDWHAEGCSVCHAVHGANTYDGTLGGKILHQRPRGRVTQPEVITALPNSTDGTDTAVAAGLYPTLADAYADTNGVGGVSGRFVQQVAFCTSCHYTYSEDAATAHQKRPAGTGTWVKNHPMIAADNTSSFTGSGTCRSCHDAGGVDQNGATIGAAIDNLDYNGATVSGYSSNNFPHYTGGNYRFISQASTAEYATDEACLKCHVSGASGVGLTF